MARSPLPGRTPTRIRYTSMSLPYHIGNGWFGGFLGDSFAGGRYRQPVLRPWYPIAIALMSVVIGGLFLRETKNVDITKQPVGSMERPRCRPRPFACGPCPLARIGSRPLAGNLLNRRGHEAPCRPAAGTTIALRSTPYSRPMTTTTQDLPALLHPAQRLAGPAPDARPARSRPAPPARGMKPRLDEMAQAIAEDFGHRATLNRNWPMA